MVSFHQILAVDFGSALKSLQRKKLNKLKQGLKIETMPVKPQTMETIWKTLCKYNIYPHPKLQFKVTESLWICGRMSGSNALSAL